MAAVDGSADRDAAAEAAQEAAQEAAALGQIRARLRAHGVAESVITELGEDDNAILTFARTLVLWDGRPAITLQELADAAGIDVELCRRARMLLGLADPGDAAVCRTEEIEAFRGLAAGVAVFGEEPILQFTRVIGSALAGVGEGALSVFARALAAGRDDGRPLEGHRYALAAFDALGTFEVVPQMVQIITKIQFDAANNRLTADVGQQSDVGIGFVDIVGSTATTVASGVEQISHGLNRFEERAVALAVAHGGRVVKFMGDEVMFVSPDVAAATHVARRLLEHVADDPVLVRARAGVAAGPVINRDGDYFGTAVNLAARLVELAEGGQTLVAGLGADQLDAIAVGPRALKGFPEPVEIFCLDVDDRRDD